MDILLQWLECKLEKNWTIKEAVEVSENYRRMAGIGIVEACVTLSAVPAESFGFAEEAVSWPDGDAERCRGALLEGIVDACIARIYPVLKVSFVLKSVSWGEDVYPVPAAFYMAGRHAAEKALQDNRQVIARS